MQLSGRVGSGPESDAAWWINDVTAWRLAPACRAQQQVTSRDRCSLFCLDLGCSRGPIEHFYSAIQFIETISFVL